jgi:uncharacterized protein GlcG (DUF336 family)
MTQRITIIVCGDSSHTLSRWRRVLLICALALTQALAARSVADSPFHDQPASPRSVPADNLPPFGMLDDRGNLVPVPAMPAGALHRGAGAPPESTAPGPPLMMAIEAARAAVESCKAAGFRVGVSVIDSAGEARAMLTADHADGSHVFVAMRKALAALEFQMPSSRASEIVPKNPALLARVTPAMFVEGGALPIHRKGALIGAIGVSGAGGDPIGHQDELCAAAGLRSLADSHPR